ncbi:MAG TPA: DUF1295 domain-containing protein [Steroidobacteraceae bacterium]|nr:DUF1295 domain-containing protein [Steroidobacteraceae bacterium]
MTTMPATIFTRRFASNYLSTLAFIGLTYWLITRVSSFHQMFLQSQWDLGIFGIHRVITIHGLMIALIALYALVLVPYYGAWPWMRSSAFTFLQGLWFAWRRRRRRKPFAKHGPMSLPLSFRLSPGARQAGLLLLLKFFFAPLMINWCLGHFATLSGSLVQFAGGLQQGLGGRALFDTAIFWAAFQAILFIDTLLFTLGYIVEVPALHNRIRSVDPTFFGWFICLACYPPFNEFTGNFLPWQSNDFPYFTNDYAHFAVNICILLALAIFSWASLALGFKASNLTNRGIVSRGPYRVVRHPAYAAKNLAWWLGALPSMAMVFGTNDWRAIAYTFVSLIGWSAIYVLRAITEERHLLMIDNGYREYARQVRWRFIPGVW